MRLTRLAPAAALALALPAATVLGTAHAAAPTAAAHRSSVTAGDPAHDVWFVDDGFRPEHRRVDGSRAIGDITSVRVAQSLGRVSLRLAERRIPQPSRRPDFEDLFHHVLLLKTPAARFDVLVGEVKGLPVEAVIESSVDEDFVDCAGVRAHVGHRSGRVRVSIPRSCLGNPAWVKVKAATMYQFAQSFERSYVDAAPGRTLTSKGKTPRAYAPAGATTRSVALRTAKHHRPLPGDLVKLLRTLHFLG